jgi:hypothetical protein
MKNVSPVCGFCECSNDPHRSIKEASYIVTRRGTVFYSETWRSHKGADEDYALSNGEGLRTFRCNVVLSSWTVGPEDEGKLDSRQGEMSRMTWIFTNTTLRISPPPTVVPKCRARNYQLMLRKIRKERNLIYTLFEALNHTAVEVLHFLVSVCQKNSQTEVGRG